MEKANPISSKQANQYDSLWAHAEACIELQGRVPNLLAVDYWSVGSLIEVVNRINGVG